MRGSVLENAHLARGFALLAAPGTDWLAPLGAAPRRRLRRLVISTVLGTDSARAAASGAGWGAHRARFSHSPTPPTPPAFVRFHTVNDHFVLLQEGASLLLRLRGTEHDLAVAPRRGGGGGGGRASVSTTTTVGWGPPSAPLSAVPSSARIALASDDEPSPTAAPAAGGAAAAAAPAAPPPGSPAPPASPARPPASPAHSPPPPPPPLAEADLLLVFKLALKARSGGTLRGR